MAVIKCKMCGGDLNITDGLTVAECEYCGSRQTIPSADNEKKMTLFTRAARLLRNCEFDKASGVFETIVADFPEEAEAYWGLVLCKYGIEYVDDPATGKKVPTCHRSSFDSVLDDANFEQACENTDALARRVYRDEARQIEELRKAIIEVSGREEPYDVFISYKETDEKGQRTLDSVIAQDIYDVLSGKGYRVFFSRISLEDKLGVEYEPYIFAALNSAKLMLVVGTDYEHFDAVWVRNEWSRFLKLMTQNKGKHLIPVFKDMDAYDMPKEFAKLTAQDMGKLGAMQDLVRGVEKILGGKKEEPREEKRETVIVQQSGGPNIQAMIDRGNMALEDRKWKDAKDFFNRALDMDAKCAEAYLGLFLIEHECSDLNEYIDDILEDYDKGIEGISLIACDEDKERITRIIEENYLPFYLEKDKLNKLCDYDRTYYTLLYRRKEKLDDEKAYFEENRNFERACKFASGSVAETINSAKDRLFSRVQKLIDEDSAAEQDDIARIKAEYAAHLDKAEAKAKELHEEEAARRETDYQAACKTADEAKTIKALNKAAEVFLGKRFVNYKDSAERAKKLRAESERLTAEEAERRRIEAEKEAERRRIAEEEKNRAEAKARKKTLILTAIILLLAVAVFFVVNEIVIPGNEYKAAEELLAAGKYDEAIAAFEALENFKDSPARVDDVIEVRNARYYAAAEELLAAGKNAEAAIVFDRLGDYEDARARSYDARVKSGMWETVSAGDYNTVGLKSDGTVVAVGNNSDGQCNVRNWMDIAIISAGFRHTVGLKADGTVVAVGRNGDGQCDVSDWTDIVAVSTGYIHTVGLKSDGTVVAVGSNDDGQRKVSGWTDIVAVSAGGYHTVGLKSDGTVVAVGSNDDGQRKVSGWTDIVAVSAGFRHTVGLKSDGTVVAVGDNYYGQCDVSDWTDIVAVSAGLGHTVGLKPDGTVVAVGSNGDGQCDVSGWTDIVAVSAGVYHTLGLKSNGTVVAVGSNDDGQRKVSGWTDIRVPEV